VASLGQISKYGGVIMDYEQKVYDLEYENKKLKEQNQELQEELNYLLGYKDNLVLINKIMKKAGKVVYQDDNYTEEFNKFWIPILQRQYFKYKLTNNKEAIEELENNVRNNWNLTKDEKIQMVRKIRG
jgi:chaperonin cofactor prefoldin